ncbi:MAG TPA: hypothetical protein VFH03_01110 [Actinoplanes sp.]|nr:hypothetical protein [Actinoplanes sp.]
MRRLGAALATLAALALTGCGAGTPAPEPARPASSAPAPAASAPGHAASESFVDVVRSRLPEVAVDRRDEEIQSIADRACTALSGGADADTIVTEARALGTLDAEATDQATARELIKVAIDTTCPDQDRRVDEF